MKKFIVIGNGNAVTYKEIFPLIKENKIWFGYKGTGGASMKFYVPDSYPLTGTCCGIDEEGRRYVGVSSGCWFTNLDTYKRPFLVLKEHYSPERYPRYDNYDAINVDRTDEIPMDYPGVMGVPISFLDKYNPDQFEIIDINPHFYSIVEQGLPKQLTLHNVNKKDPYARILIRFKEGKIDPLGYGIATPDRDWVANPQTYDCKEK